LNAATSTTAAPATPVPPAAARGGLLLGLLGVLSFSLTLPMTRLAVAGLDAGFVAFGRMAIAGLIAATWLAFACAPRPARADFGWLAASSLGIVVGFPLLSSLAMTTIPANHGAIINGALPFATALLAALWLGERHGARFWWCAAGGSALVIAFALRDGGTVSAGDLAMLGAVAAGAVGYVCGGHLATRIGGIHTILWALAVALPLTLPVAVWLALTTPLAASPGAWAGFAYVTVVSQLVGFFAWYSGLARGGVARVGQVQLLQVFFTIGFAALLFGEPVAPTTWLFATGVVAMIWLGRTGRAQ
jgi:drug/metabolite transporter (DMT)-like permease